MLVGDLAKQYDLKVNEFVFFLRDEYKKQFKEKVFGSMYDSVIDDSVAQEAAERFKAKQNAVAEKKRLIAEEEARIAQLVRTMPITSGNNFEGYRIVRYAGYVSGDEVATVPMGFFTGLVSNDDVNETIKKVRNIAIQEMKEAAANLDCNAVIGLDFDYITIDRSGPQGTLEIKIVLTANGTAVEIEPL